MDGRLYKEIPCHDKYLTSMSLNKWRGLYVEKLASLFPSLVSRARLPKQLQQFSSLANPSLMLFLLYRLERWKRQMMAWFSCFLWMVPIARSKSQDPSPLNGLLTSSVANLESTMSLEYFSTSPNLSGVEVQQSLEPLMILVSSKMPLVQLLLHSAGEHLVMASIIATQWSPARMSLTPRRSLSSRIEVYQDMRNTMVCSRTSMCYERPSDTATKM